MSGIIRSRHRTRLSALALLVAYLPTLLFMGHSLVPQGDATPAAAARESNPGHDHDSHTRHCHANFASCADQPAAPGTTQLSLIEELAPAAHLSVAALSAASDVRPAAFVAAVPAPPPRNVA